MKQRTRGIHELHSELEGCVQSRNIREGFALLDELCGVLRSERDFEFQDLISLTLCVAQWMDLGYRDHTIYKTLMEHLPRHHPDLQFLNVMRLNLIEGYWRLSNEDPDGAIEILNRTYVAGIGLMPEY